VTEASPIESTRLVAGVDGCRAGWVVVVATPQAEGPLVSVTVEATITGVVERVRRNELAVMAIDMPLGLAASGPRACDTTARRRLGARRSTVFPTPPRPLLHSPSHAEAVTRGRALDGRGISIQAFNLLPRMAELDAAVDPSMSDRIVEAHPESGFATMAGAPLRSSKKTVDGRAERLALLEGALSRDLSLLSARRAGAAIDDVLDAAANAWTARRWLAGAAIVLGDGTLDERGLPMRIVI